MSDDMTTRASDLARELHEGQTRKCTKAPYFDGHLQPVADLVRSSGGTDAQIAAAYLHDAAEDAGGQDVLDRIADEIGEEVADMVEHLSDSLTDTTAGADKEPWTVRKRRYLRDLADAPRAVLEVSVADKLHNARSILSDYTATGPKFWVRFNEKRPEYQLWYYGSLTYLFAERLPDHPLTGELTRCFDELRDRVRADVPDIDDLLTEASAELSHRSRFQGRRLVAFGRPPFDDPEAMDRFVEDMVAQIKEAAGDTEGEGSPDGHPRR
jgi:(p)ppGpp synthase/HD superfamily hydrolase